MQLKQYLKYSDKKISDLSEYAGVKLTTVYRWATGISMPTRGKLLAIEQWSNGAVTANDFMQLYTKKTKEGMATYNE
jgi:transcriptional regulator with XRE-family HTH domain